MSGPWHVQRHAGLPLPCGNYLNLRSETTHTVSQRRRTHVARYRIKAGATAPRGACSSRALAPPHQRRQVPETGRVAGSATRRGPFPYAFAIVSCPRRPVRAHFFAFFLEQAGPGGLTA